MNFEHRYKLVTKTNYIKRVYAGLIDYGLVIFYSGSMLYLFGEPGEDGGYHIQGWLAFSVMLMWFILTIGMEYFTGSTLGNRSLHLRVAPMKDPRKNISFEQSLKRHLLDMFDLWPLGIIGTLTICNTRYNQRLGDLWAKTVVLDLNDPGQGLQI